MLPSDCDKVFFGGGQHLHFDLHMDPSDLSKSARHAG